MDPTSYPQVLAPFHARCSERDYGKGDVVFRMGDEARAVFYLLGGEVHLQRHGPEGKTAILHRVRAQGFFAEASLGAGHYHCTALCVRPSRILALPRELLRERLAHDPDFTLDWVAGLCAELRRQRTTVERLQLRGAEARIRHYLLTEGSPRGALELGFTLTQWADLLGLTRETLYRTLARMESTGVLVRSGNCVQLREAPDNL
jgi:CRP/FNR family transcriptional regulator, dissimilatory nitrate respiration regulator